jgi:hypothetical protein
MLAGKDRGKAMKKNQRSLSEHQGIKEQHGHVSITRKEPANQSKESQFAFDAML